MISKMCICNRYYGDTLVNKANHIRRRWLEISSNLEYTEEMRANRFDRGIVARLEQSPNESFEFLSVKSNLLGMPTNKTSSLEKYCRYLRHWSGSAFNIFNFNMFNTTRKWSFNTFVKKQKVSFLFYFDV